ncbi:cytidine/deoxycytidylate deaminase family protein [Enterococcus rivorum]|nr:cytidine deaminase [Enterococcus rivorum]MBP2100715.1 cytidine deaminase [Enterococcus rivorum]
MMEKLTVTEKALIDSATEIIKLNFDRKNLNHTVGAAVRYTNGNVYSGVNVSSIHEACAEVIAIGNAISCGERDFECIVAIGRDNSDKVYSPCGNCRQFILEYAPNCHVIVETEAGIKKSRITSLVPYAYHRPE